jgi:hypothetical protein
MRFYDGSDSEHVSNFVHISEKVIETVHGCLNGMLGLGVTEPKSMLIFFDISGIVHKEFILAGQTSQFHILL